VIRYVYDEVPGAELVAPSAAAAPAPKSAPPASDKPAPSPKQ
jgi:hypothetical protein